MKERIFVGLVMLLPRRRFIEVETQLFANRCRAIDHTVKRIGPPSRVKLYTEPGGGLCGDIDAPAGLLNRQRGKEYALELMMS